MAWQFTEWKRFAGAGTGVAVVLAVVGLLVNDVPWWKRDHFHYLTMRDYNEMVGGFGERETANATTTNFVPLQSHWWWGAFPEKNIGGTVVPFSTNAVGVYDAKPFFDGLDKVVNDFFPFEHPSVTRIRFRHWVSTNAAGIVSVAGTFNELETDYNIIAVNNSYMMLLPWWKTNIFDGATYYPEVVHYENTNTVEAIRRSMAACRYQLGVHVDPYLSAPVGNVTFRGGAQSYNIVSGEAPPGWGYEQEASWDDLIAEAHADMLAAETEPDWDNYGCSKHKIDASWSCWTYDNTWRDGSTWKHYTVDVRGIVIEESVTVCAATEVTVGRNMTAVGIGRPSRLWSDSEDAPFYHGVHGWTEPTTLITESGTFVEFFPNVRRWFNEVLRFDGHSSIGLIEMMLALAEGDTFHPIEGTSYDETSGSLVIGWDQEPYQCGILVDWSFDHFAD